MVFELVSRKIVVNHVVINLKNTRQISLPTPKDFAARYSMLKCLQIFYILMVIAQAR